MGDLVERLLRRIEQLEARLAAVESRQVQTWPQLAAPAFEGAMLVSLTGGGGTNGFAWAEAAMGVGTNAATTLPGGRTSTVYGVAYPTGSRVLVFPAMDRNGNRTNVFMGGDRFPARITDTNGAYVEIALSGGSWSDVTGGASGTSSAELNGATGWRVGDRVVMTTSTGGAWFDKSIRIAHNNTHVGYASCLQVDSSRGTHNLVEFAMLAGTNGAGLHFKASGSAYQVMQNDSSNNNVVFDDPRVAS